MSKKKELEKELVARKLDKIDREIKADKRKLLTSDQALGKYAKYLKETKK